MKKKEETKTELGAYVQVHARIHIHAVHEFVHVCIVISTVLFCMSPFEVGCIPLTLTMEGGMNSERRDDARRDHLHGGRGADACMQRHGALDCSVRELPLHGPCRNREST